MARIPRGHEVGMVGGLRASSQFPYGGTRGETPPLPRIFNLLRELPFIMVR